jgi:transcriptional regulator with XRE-family HTH domain
MKSPNFIDRNVGSRLRQLRLARGIDPHVLAQELGIPSLRLEALERGRERITAETMRQLARILQAPPSDFFKGLTTEGRTTAESPTVEAATAQEKQLIGDFARIFDAKSREIILTMVAAYAEFGDLDKQ